jgi:hypothetical protein
MERVLGEEKQNLTAVKKRILQEVKHANTSITDHSKSKESIKKHFQSLTKSQESSRVAKEKQTLTT